MTDVQPSRRRGGLPSNHAPTPPYRWGVVLAGLMLGLPTAEAACVAEQPVVRDLRAERFYVDAASSIPDPAAIARNRQALAALDASLGAIIAHSDRHLENGSASEAECALAQMAVQAAGGAMLGETRSLQADHERKWRTAGMAIAYLTLRASADPARRAVIEPWLAGLADRVDAAEGRPKAWNNHHYWVGLVDTAVGDATDDPVRSARGRAAFDDGLAAIGADGTLPREMERGARALHYHAYALAPLAMAAEIAARRGEDWWSLRDGALHRLVGRVAAGLDDPAWFSSRVGVTVEVPRGGILGWAAFYDRRFPGRLRVPDPTADYRYGWLGGDLGAMARRWIP